MKKVWVVYSINSGYPEDPELSMDIFRIYTVKSIAEELVDLSSEVYLQLFSPILEKRRAEAVEVLKKKYGLTPDEIPGHLKIAEGELDESRFS